MARRKAPYIPDQLLDPLLAGADPRTAFDPNDLLDGLKKALAERVLNAEMDHYLRANRVTAATASYPPSTAIARCRHIHQGSKTT